MKFEGDFSEPFRECLKIFKDTAIVAAERKEQVNNAPKNSKERKIQQEIFNKKYLPPLTERAKYVYSAIVSYTSNPEKLKLFTKDDILEAQIVQDEVKAILDKVGIFIDYTQKKREEFKR